MKFEEHIGTNIDMTGGREGGLLPVSMSTPQQIVRHVHKHNLRQRFELVKTLGQGTYGKVKLAIDRATGQQVAIKYIRKTKIDSELDLRRIRREIDIMSSLHHPHIISIYEVFENKEKIILVMEYANGGELYDYINERKQLTEDEARKFFRQIVSAISNCHKRGIVHRDLKLENILLDSNFNVKIADFGLSNHYNNTDLLRTFCGSPLYASPEIVNGLPYSGPEVDCWSLGVLLYTLVYGAMPFDGSDFKRLRKQISEGDYYEPSQPSDASGLIARLLTVDPVKRAKMADICEHWWVNLNLPFTPVDHEFLEEEVKVPRKYRGRTLSLSSSDSDGDYKCPHSSHHRKVVARRRHGHSKAANNRWSSEFEDEAVFMADDLDTMSTLVPSQIPSVSANDEEIEEASLNQSDCLKTLKASNSASNSDSNEGEISSCTETTPSRTDVFDSRKKPKRGILKNKGKYTGHDSGCVLDDHRAAVDEHRSADRKESAESAYGSTTSYELADIESVLNALDDTDSHERPRCRDEEDVTPRTATITRHPSAGKYDYQQADFDSSSEHMGVVRRRPKSILKKHSKYGSESDQLKRYSIGSQSSNSSADLLDFSYDSGEGENYMTQYYTHVNELTCGQYITGEEESTPKNGGFLMPDEETLRKIALMDAISRDTIRHECEAEEPFGLAEVQNLYQQAYATCNALQ